MKLEHTNIGMIGVDAVGVRFIVLRPGGAKGSEPQDEPNYVVVLPSHRGKKLPGTVLHFSWLEAPISWETT